MNNAIDIHHRFGGRRRSLATRLGAVALVGGLVFGVLACGSDSGSSESTGTTAGSDAATSVAATVTAADGWSRSSPMGQTVGAGYMKLTGGATDESLVAATVSADISASVELHEVVMTDGDDAGMDDMSGDSDMGGIDDMSGDGDMGDMSGDGNTGGMMRMQEVPSIAVPAGATVMLEPGGFHLMFIGLAAPLTVGQTFDVTLEFASGEKLVVPLEVRGS